MSTAFSPSPSSSGDHSPMSQSLAQSQAQSQVQQRPGDGHTSTEDTANSVVDDANAPLFSFRDLARIDEALTMSTKETGLRFTLYIGDLGRDTRATVEDMHQRSGGDVTKGVLVAISPGQRVVEIVTGTAAARRLPDRACALAVLSMTNRFGSGDLVGGIVNGFRQLSDSAGHPARRGH